MNSAAEVKHTPGPWKARILSWGAGYPQGFGIFPAAPTAELPEGIEQHSIASANLYEHSAYTAFFTAEAIEANARLIAAAPDLLAQHEVNVVDLKFLRRAIEEGDPKAELLVRVADILKRSRAAIAKATQPAA